MVDSASSSSDSSLLCFEDGEPCASQQTQHFDMTDLFNSCFVLGDDDEGFIQQLIKKETTFGSKNGVFSGDDSSKDQAWLKSARLDAIRWMFNVCSLFKALFFISYLFFPFIYFGFPCFCDWFVFFTEKSKVWVPVPHSLSFCVLLRSISFKTIH